MTAVVKGDHRSLTLRAESRAGGELGYVHDLDSKLLPRLPVDASSHHAEGTPGGHGEDKFETQTFKATRREHKHETKRSKLHPLDDNLLAPGCHMFSSFPLDVKFAGSAG